MEIVFRDATRDDAEFISAGFHRAMLLEDEVSETQIKEFAHKVCTRDDVLYSARNTTIATLTDGTPVGMITAYEGARYRGMREVTMDLMKREFSLEFPGMEDETVAGEYYLDSLSVSKPYCSRGIGRRLLEYATAKGEAMGLKVTLVVDPANPKAKALYERIGFREIGEIFIFGHDYIKMQKM